MREVGCIKEKAVGDDAVEFVLKELLVEIIGVPRRDLDSSASHKHFLHQTDGDAASTDSTTPTLIVFGMKLRVRMTSITVSASPICPCHKVA